MAAVSNLSPMVVDKSVRPALEAKLTELGKELGIQFKIRSGTCAYDNKTANMKLEMALVNSDTGIAETKERSNYALLARARGLPADGLDKIVRCSNKRFKITGLNTRARVRPVITECLDDGHTYTFPVDTIVALLNAPK